MEESLKLRVERLFGSRLFETVPRSSFPDSSWSVTDGEVERKEWNRERGGSFPDREEMPCASAYDECFPKNAGRSGASKKRRFEDDLDDLDEEEEEEGEREGEAGGGGDGGDAEREEREIRSSIGLDSTLDYEEEEDEYDRAAVGSEDASDRMYMRDVKDHGPYINYHTIIEDASEEVHFARDPRADHFAASVRLKEDKDSGKSFQFEMSPRDVTPKAKITKSVVNLKPILKRKGEQINSRPKKQVRFGLERKDLHDEQLNDSQDLLTVPESTEATGSAESSSLPPEDSPKVPDYIRNPSKYVHYTFDSVDDINDDSNRSAFYDCWKIIRASKSEDVQPDGSIEPPKSIIFTPRKRAGDSVSTDHIHSLRGNHNETLKESTKELVHVAAHSLGIAATEAQENEVCAMEEDSMDIPVEKSATSQKSCRQYRSRTCSDDSSC